MTPSHTLRLTLGAAGALFLAACRTASPASSGATVVTPAPAGTYRVPSPVEKARADSARLPYTAADVAFMQRMIQHHAQAIAMSTLAPTHGASAEVVRLADRIINAQQDEIVTMQQWLANRRQDVPAATPTGMTMKMNGVEHEMPLAGMLRPEQMAQLDRARGAEFDRLFLTFMIQHHRGAVAMVRELFDTTGAGQDEVTFKFANDVGVDQTTEIARMESMLAALPK